jgi:methylated-DNA-protein-cysteine methyltransferase related protein
VKGDYSHIYDVVREIPRGRVATYGQIADLAGIPGQPRRIGYALSALPPDSNVPWHRVINARGEISLRAAGGTGNLQKKLLKQEGVRFDREGKVSLEHFRWRT